MKNLNLEQLKSLIIASIILIVGILFCCSLSMGIEGLSTMIGLILLVIGIAFVFGSLVNTKNLISTNGLSGVAIISLGIMFIANKLAGIIFLFIPWFLIIFGIILICDVLIGKFYRQEVGLVEFIVKLCIGGVAFVLGLCLKLIDGFLEYASVMLGILMILYSIYLIFTVFTNKKTQVQN